MLPLKVGLVGTGYVAKLRADFDRPMNGPNSPTLIGIRLKKMTPFVKPMEPRAVILGRS
jgi:hypothetical protein